MRFMMLMIPKGYETAKPGTMPEAKAVAAMMKYNEELAKAGVLLGLDGLHPPSMGARVSFEGGTPKVTDGPFAEAKEVLGGYWMIQVKSRQEAIEFYRSALGAQVLGMMRFKDVPDQPAGRVPPGAENKVMHAAFKIGETTVLASDGECTAAPHFEGISLSLTAPTDADAERMFAALAEGGQVKMPLARTFFSSRFGMVTDRFGVAWMVSVG
jgi:hypothetical protein